MKQFEVQTNHLLLTLENVKVCQEEVTNYYYKTVLYYQLYVDGSVYLLLP